MTVLVHYNFSPYHLFQQWRAWMAASEGWGVGTRSKKEIHPWSLNPADFPALMREAEALQGTNDGHSKVRSEDAFSIYTMKLLLWFPETRKAVEYACISSRGQERTCKRRFEGSWGKTIRKFSLCALLANLINSFCTDDTALKNFIDHMEAQ